MIEGIKNQIKKAIPDSGIEIEISAPEKDEFGHYSTNVAFKSWIVGISATML